MEALAMTMVRAWDHTRPVQATASPPPARKLQQTSRVCLVPAAETWGDAIGLPGASQWARGRCPARGISSIDTVRDIEDGTGRRVHNRTERAGIGARQTSKSPCRPQLFCCHRLARYFITLMQAAEWGGLIGRYMGRLGDVLVSGVPCKHALSTGTGCNVPSADGGPGDDKK